MSMCQTMSHLFDICFKFSSHVFSMYGLLAQERTQRGDSKELGTTERSHMMKMVHRELRAG